MNKKEVSEIKKQFSPEHCSISRICGCYVDGEKNKKTEFREAFLSLPEEDMFKYFEILRKGLTGKIGRNLINFTFPKETERAGGSQEFLLNLRNSRLKDDELLDAFYDRIIDSYDYVGNYLILLIHDAYDIPGRTSDGIEMEDASDDVYSYVMCCICPVDLSKPGLGYNEQKNSFQNRNRDWVVGQPDTGFLFPAFNDRSADIHSALTYAKKNLQAGYIRAIFGCEEPLDSEYQRDAFNALVEGVLGIKCTSKAVKDIHDNLRDILQENADSPEPLILDKQMVKDLFEKSEADMDDLEDFDALYDSLIGDHEVYATNLVNEKEIIIRTPEATVKVDANCSSMAEVRMIDGKKCLVIDISGEFEVDGVKCER